MPAPLEQRILANVAASGHADRITTIKGYSGVELRPMEGTKEAWRFDQALDEPTVSFDLKETRNRVEVWDQDKKGQPDPVVRVELPAAHPLSKESLSRNGKDRILVERIQLDDMKVPIDKATRIGREALDRMSDGMVDVRFEHLPIPHLELGNRVALDTPRYPDLRFRVRAFTLPLGAGDSMSIGYTRAIRFAPSRKRRVHKIGG